VEGHASAATSAFRRVEIASLGTFGLLVLLLGAEAAPHLAAAPLVGLAACLAGYLASDFTSGLVHWIADTWGSRETPIVGRALIGPFREHHLDPEAITRHDFVETNGANCLISIPVAILALAVPLGPGPLQHGRLFAASFLGVLIVWTFGTNQFHKWAHADTVPRIVARLQEWRLILPPALHGRHHHSPYTDDYCITSGWLNEPLRRLCFFRRLERAIAAATGAKPRQNSE
jgi:ubiquitin-conjugating enzyme E2 variant